jgi:hypothetical protein
MFSDIEQFAGNLATAGTLDIAVDYTVSVRTYKANTIHKSERTIDGNTEGGIELGSLHPGDRGRVDLCPRVSPRSNPAYLWLCGGLTNTSNGKGGNGNGPHANSHNLSEALQARIRYVTPAADTDPLWCPDSTTDDTGVLFEGSFADVLSQLSAGLPLDADGRPGTAPGSQRCFQPGENNICLRFEWCLPESADNKVAKDTVEFELVFRARQCRHTDGTVNPCQIGDDTAQAISFIAFCTADGNDDFEVALRYGADDTTATGEVTAVDWEVTEGNPDIETVVLYYARTFENFYYAGEQSMSGTAAVGSGDDRLSWPPGGKTRTGQRPSSPCPDGQGGVKYEWLEQAQKFDQA